MDIATLTKPFLWPPVSHSWKWWLGIFLGCSPATLCWLINSKASFIGFWTLPIGVLSFWINLLCLLTSLFLLLRYRYRLFALFSILNLFLFLQDFRWYLGETSGISILSWNIGGKQQFTPDQKTKLPCVLSHINQWKEEQESSIIFLQEVPKKLEKSFEQYLGVQCYWTHYTCTKPSCNGLLLCSDDSWKFRLEQHREFNKGSRYGYLQLELFHKPTNQTINAINVHLESLYRTATHFPEIKKRSSFVKTIQEQPDIELLLTLLSQHAAKQREEMDRLYDVLRQLKDPTIIAGDFNAPSSLWMHHRLQEDFVDAHAATGRGFGNTTFRWGFLVNRINYLYASPQLPWSGPTKVHLDATCSDHHPISSWISLPQ